MKKQLLIIMLIAICISNSYSQKIAIDSLKEERVTAALKDYDPDFTESKTMSQEAREAITKWIDNGYTTDLLVYPNHHYIMFAKIYQPKHVNKDVLRKFSKNIHTNKEGNGIGTSLDSGKKVGVGYIRFFDHQRSSYYGALLILIS